MNRTGNRPAFAPTALAIAISLVTAHLQAADLPTGGNIVGGSGSISQDGNSLNVQQNSDKLITNWDSFDIGAGNTVNFHQPGSNSVALNRVIGEDASAIYGNLNANGKVFLVNPNGVLFGEGAAVNVGALVASTLSLSDQNFNDGNYQFQGDGNNAAVINRGSLKADNGTVALLGGQVSNQGIIQANQGNVALAAGDKVSLDFAGDGLLNVTVDESAIDALVENHQLIRANGGQVVMTASATDALLQTVVNNTGIIEAQTLDKQSGTIVLKGGFNGGTVNVAGTLDASAPDSGDGGFIDTSGAHVKIADGTQVTTKANNGTTGEWLIDPTDFYITDSSDPQTDSGIGAATLSANLEDSNITLATIEAGTDAGDIHVDAAVSWNANTTLSLKAHNDIHINQGITATGTNAGLVLNTGADKDYSIASGVSVTLSGSNAALNINGTDYTLIHDMAALDNIDTTGLGGAYALAKNLDASGTTYDHVLVGVGATDAFTGTFAGLGHTVSDLTIENTAATTEYWGLFGQNQGTIRDIGLVGGGITVEGNSGSVVGSLVGRNFSGTISNAYATGSVSAMNDDMAYVGGLVGVNTYKGTISKAYAIGDVSATSKSGYAKAGGLVGSNFAAITNAYATGNVSAISNSGRSYAGGLVGTSYTTIPGNFASITNAYATGAATANGSENSYTTAAGGLVAENGGSINNAYATGVATTNGNSYRSLAGGLVADNRDGTINNAYATGAATASDGENSSAGGLVAENTGAITNVYATGTATALASLSSLAGGLAGENWGSISHAYSTGMAVTNKNQAGGFAGYNDGTITESYWDTDTSGLTTGSASAPPTGTTGLVTGLTSNQLMNAASFSAWDINAQGGTDSIWRIYEGYTAPLLRSFLTTLEVNVDDSSVTYDGSSHQGSWSATAEYDVNRIFGHLSGGGRNAGNYDIDMSGLHSNQQGYDLITKDGTLTINKAQATVTANSNTTTYDGTEQSGSGFTATGLVNGETESVLTGVTTSGGGRNAGTYKLTASGSADNYELTFVDGTLTIERKAITGNISADGKTYDGSTYANTHGTLDDVISGDDLQFNTTGAFANKTAGDGKQVDVSGSLGGGDAGNYVLTTNSTTTANIDHKTITADVRALDKLFDGSLAATLEGVLNGTISGDEVALQLSGLFASLKPGENRVLVDAELIGADAGNYRLIAPSEVIARLQGFVQSADYQSAIDSQPQEQRELSAPSDTGYALKIDTDALRLSAAK
ncbi:filamentous hemagglutinin N-terminal domain-containing protein [Pseudomonas neustonica]|uniref:Filamentous hemagglutinin N-terminal domain-containing protein n=1 Tax=Pseudomonas neustonica TaxID=2487346 RepID=A0ABX9XLA5_9PSED|nr:GLUG motif-containing protein [Pseudomonas neustonica]ROZ87594.1 filamentous hemagglutinin N-terminal domain-containing protein [Pseudomonas neustonica]